MTTLPFPRLRNRWPDPVGHGYTPEPSAKDERRAGFENGIIVGIIGTALVITGLIALFSHALGV